jgi:hypothetical protein
LKPTTGSKPDRVDRALASARRSVGRLVALLGEEDQAVLEDAARGLAGFGPFAVGPPAAALPRAVSPRHRAAISTHSNR